MDGLIRQQKTFLLPTGTVLNHPRDSTVESRYATDPALVQKELLNDFGRTVRM
jgi:hypothetical protein